VPRFLLVALTLVVCSWNLSAAPAPAPIKKGPSAEQIQQAIEELSSTRFAVRERASKFLWEAGAAAEEALRLAAKSKDEETSNRAKAILEKFDWGLYPDTPPEIVKLIEKFRGGDAAVRQEAVGELIRMKPTRFGTLRKLISQEQDPDTRQQMYQTMAFQARQAVPSLLVTGQLDEASDLLEICVSTSNTMSLTDYAALQYLRNRTPAAIQRIEALRKSASEPEGRRMSEMLVYLHRIQKDWPAARKAAEDSKNKTLLNDIAWEANDWKALTSNPGDDDVGGDSRGELAAYHRLAGNKAEYDKIVADLRKDLAGVEGDDGAAFNLAHALLLNGQGAEAIAVLKERPKRQPELIFDMLCAQLKYKEAFELANQVAKELEKDEENAFRRDELDLQKAKVLAGLGDRDAATQVFRGVFDRALSGDRFRIGSQTSLNAVKAVARSGMRDLAAECTARVLVHQEKQGLGDFILAYLDPIFDDDKHAAQVWWAALRREAPNAEPGVTMARALEFADGKADRKKVDKLVESIQKLHASFAAGDKNAIDGLFLLVSQAQTDFAVAEAYRIAGVKDQAEAYYKKAADSKMADPQSTREDPDEFFDDDSPSPLPPRYKYTIAYADFLLGEKRYKEAMELYRKAWELAPAQALPLFMTGFARTKLGDEREGARLMGLAHWVPLGSDAARSRFSDELSRRGFDADSRREMELILSVCWFRSHHVGNTLLRAARIKSRAKDYATAAMYYEKDVISLFRTGAHFVEPKAYLTVPELSRTHRARALFAAGKIDEAMTEIRAGLNALPGNVEVAIGFVPDLEKAGKKKEADEVYQKVKNAFESALKDYGNSPDLRNSIAWTMVNCNRDLDDALKHAQKAVEQAPKTAGYIDTLAEVYFRKKDRAKALEYMKQCAALEPHNPYFRKQLERFEKKPFDSPLPDEETGDD